MTWRLSFFPPSLPSWVLPLLYRWIPLLKEAHNHTVSWAAPSHTPAQTFDAILDACTAFNDQTPGMNCGNLLEKMEIKQQDRAAGFIQVYAWTSNMEWLDVVQFTVTAASVGGGADIRARGFATGLIPTAWPLAPLLSCVFFWVPFSDAGGALSKRIEMIKAEASKTVSFVGGAGAGERTSLVLAT